VPGLHDFEEKESMNWTHSREKRAFENGSKLKHIWKDKPWSTSKGMLSDIIDEER